MAMVPDPLKLESDTSRTVGLDPGETTALALAVPVFVRVTCTGESEMLDAPE